MKFNIKKVAAAFLSVAMLTTGSAQLSVFAQQTLKYEAENGTLGGSAYIQTDSSASGSRTVRFSDSSCTWSQTVTVSESGYYKIKLYSRGEGSNKINNLSVNGSNAGTFSSANGSAYKASTVNGIYLKKGQNTVKITMSWGYFSLDYITIEKMSVSNAYTAAENLVDPYASQSTQRLYSYMKDVYGKKVITGQYCDGGLNGTEFKAIKSATGQTPAMLGLDFMRYTPCRVQNGDTSDAVEKAIEFSRAGGIVTFCWHWNVPDKYLLSGTDGGNPRWWGGFYTKNVDRSKFSLTKIMNGSDPKGYDTLMSDVDEIAKQLKRLSDADVPVLFRPLHEASGGWFWWGADGSEAYKKLWQAIYDKLTNEYKLDNIIWVWNGQAANWYPGDEYVDIIGEDIYPGTRDYSAQSSKYLEATDCSPNGKIVALTENGCLFDLDKAFDANTAWSYFGTWSGEFCISSSEKYTEKSMWQKVYNSDYAVTLSSLPDLKSYPISSDNTQITLDSTSKEVTYGDSITLKASVTSGTPQTVTWKSSNTAVATVKDGVVTATGKGTAKITASLPNGRSAVCTVKVTTKKLPTSGYSYASTAQYTGSAIIPTVTVKDGSKVLRQNIDYRVIVTNNVKIGHANIIISGMGNYYGSYTAGFDIIPAKQTIQKLETRYKGFFVDWAQKGSATGYDIQYSTGANMSGAASKHLTANKPDNLTISGLTADKTYYVRVRSYTNVGSKTYYGPWSDIKSIKTAKYDITKASVSGISTKAYTGKAITQNITVKYNGIALKNGTDYTTSYSNNKKIGKAIVKITGKGKYGGIITKTFTINPAKQEIQKLTSKSKAFFVDWAQKGSATGYEIQYATNSKFANAKKVTITNNKTDKTTISKLSGKKKYYVRVRSYTTVNGTKYYGAWSVSKSVTTKK